MFFTLFSYFSSSSAMINSLFLSLIFFYIAHFIFDHHLLHILRPSPSSSRPRFTLFHFLVHFLLLSVLVLLLSPTSHHHQCHLPLHIFHFVNHLFAPFLVQHHPFFLAPSSPFSIPLSTSSFSSSQYQHHSNNTITLRSLPFLSFLSLTPSIPLRPLLTLFQFTVHIHILLLVHHHHCQPSASPSSVKPFSYSLSSTLLPSHPFPFPRLLPPPSPPRPPQIQFPPHFPLRSALILTLHPPTPSFSCFLFNLFHYPVFSLFFLFALG